MTEKENSKSDPLEPIKTAPAEVGNVIKKVLKLEHEHLYQDRPRVNDDILRIIKDEVK
jgi:hypothetical protein